MQGLNHIFLARNLAGFLFHFSFLFQSKKGGGVPPKERHFSVRLLVFVWFCWPLSPLKPTKQVGLLVCFFLLASVFSNQPSRAYYLLWLPQAKKNPDARFVCFSLGFPTQKGARNAFLATPRRSEPKAKAASKAGLRGSAPVQWFDSTFWASGHLCFFLFFYGWDLCFSFWGDLGGPNFFQVFVWFQVFLFSEACDLSPARVLTAGPARRPRARARVLGA